MKKTIFTLIFVLISSATCAHPCTSQMNDPEEESAYNKDAYAAYDFGIKIQDAVRRKDSTAFLALMQKELSFEGPRRSVIKSHPFDEIFPAEWQQAVLREKPECGKTREGNYTFSGGSVQYEKIDGSTGHYTITSLAMDFDESKYLSNKNLPKGWKIDGRLIPPHCLPRPWISGDNFESYAEYYNLNETEFMHHPGKFFGKPIQNLDYVINEWSSQVVSPLDACKANDKEFVVQEDNSILWGKIPEAESYKILGELLPQECAKLAPHYSIKPKQCYAIHVTEYVDGTMGQYDTDYIYGLFRTKDRNYILPLLSFENQNEMAAYIEDHLQ